MLFKKIKNYLYNVSLTQSYKLHKIYIIIKNGIYRMVLLRERHTRI